MNRQTKFELSRRQRAALATAIVAAFALPLTAHAGSFQLPTDGAAGFSRANAGGGLFPDDPTAAFNNPAAMSFFSGPVVQASADFIRPQAQFNGSVTDVEGNPVSGGNPNGFGKFIPFPNIAWVAPVNDWFALGGSLMVPYGLRSTYNPQWEGRYFGTDTNLQSVEVSLSAAFKLNDRFSAGVGILGQRTKAELNTVIDTAGAADALLGAPLLTPQSADTQLNVNVKRKFSFGYFVGFEFKPTDQDSIGWSYHSRVQNTLSGTYSVYGGALGKELLTLAPTLVAGAPSINPNGGNASAQLDTPAYAEVDWLHAFTPRLSLAATVKWTQWSTFQDLTLVSDGQTLVSLPQQYKDSYLYSIGGDYKLNDRWTVRAGIGYDESPSNIISRDPRVPDGNRKLLGFGFGYRATDHLSVDLGYQHQFVGHTPVDITNQAILGGSTMQGYFDDSGDVVSISGTYHF